MQLNVFVRVTCVQFPDTVCRLRIIEIRQRENINLTTYQKDPITVVPSSSVPALYSVHAPCKWYSIATVAPRPYGQICVLFFARELYY